MGGILGRGGGNDMGRGGPELFEYAICTMGGGGIEEKDKRQREEDLKGYSSYRAQKYKLSIVKSYEKY